MGHRLPFKMEAIKKKMQAMKLDKDNAMDQADACEQKAKDANIRAEKAEEEVRDLQKKMQQLESDLDVTQEKFMNANQRLEEKKRHCKMLKERLLLLIVVLHPLKRISKHQKKDCSLPHKNLIWLQHLVMITNVCAKSWKTNPCQMKPVWKPLKANSRMPES